MRGRRSGKTCAGSAGGVESGEIDAKDYGARCGRDRTRLGRVLWYSRAGLHSDHSIGASALSPKVTLRPTDPLSSPERPVL